MLSFSGSPLVCNAVLLLMGVIIFMVKQLFCCFLEPVLILYFFLYYCIPLLLSLAAILNQVVWTTIGREREVFVLREQSERLRELSLGAKMVADRGCGFSAVRRYVYASWTSVTLCE